MMPPQAHLPQGVAAAGQAAKAAAQKSWEAGRQGMGFLGRLVTGGGRAAYTEFFRPVAVAEGYIITQPATASVTAPLEAGAFLFVAALLLGWLVFLLPENWMRALVLLVGWIGLLAISRAGARWLSFSRLTLTRLLSLLGNKAKGQVWQVRFTVNNQATNQPVDVVIVGPREGIPPAHGQWARVWGTADASRNEIRTWKVQMIQQNGQPFEPYIADRLIPLTVAFFVPLVLVTLAVLLTILLAGGTP
jgi:hypothetical protein